MHAGAAGLGNLTLVTIDNRSSSIAMGDIAGKLAAFGWDAVTVDGRDHHALREAFGRRGDGYVEVLEGISRGEEVVTAATFLIDAESNLRAALQAFTQPEAPK